MIDLCGSLRDDPDALVLAAAAIAMELGRGKDADTLELLSVLLTAVADLLAIYALRAGPDAGAAAL